MLRSLLLLLSMAAMFILTGCATGQSCGPKTCAQGEHCCNRGCGICVKPGQACILPFCEWGRPAQLDAEGATPSVDVFDRVAGGVSYEDTTLAIGNRKSPTSAQAIWADAQGRFFGPVGARLRLGATRHVLGDSEPPLGWSSGLGLTFAPGVRAPGFRWALTSDLELRQGPALPGAVGLRALSSEEMSATASLGAAMTFGHRDAITVSSRLFTTLNDSGVPLGVMEVGIGGSTDLTWLSWLMGGPTLPLYLRGDYRHQFTHEDFSSFKSHEVTGGLHWRFDHTLRAGLELGAHHERHQPSNLTAASRTVMLRAAWHWDSNY